MALIFAVMHLYDILNFLLLLSIPFYISQKSGIDKLTEWSTIPACSSLMCCCCFFSTGAIPKGLILQKNCLTFVYTGFIYVNLCQDWFFWFLEDLWFEDLCAG